MNGLQKYTRKANILSDIIISQQPSFYAIISTTCIRR